MELIKKNIHMDRIKCKASVQITLEDDMIVPDSKPDIETLIFDRASIKIEDMKTMTDHVCIKGKLNFQVLYLGEGGDRIVNSLEGNIPFDEKIYMEGLENGENIMLDKEIEDVTMGLINPRKLSVQSILTLTTWVEELYDVESGVDVSFAENIECKKKTVESAEIVMQKRDIFRLKQETELPQNLPNVFSIIWHEMTLGEVEWKPLDDKIAVQGELHVFVLYEGEGEEQPIRWYNTTLPFSGVIDCYGCKEHMMLDLNAQMDHAELEIRPDFDGEERILGIEMLLNLSIKLYEENKIELLTDVYGIRKELTPVTSKEMLKSLLIKNVGKTKLSEKVKLKAAQARALQICHSTGEIQIEDITVEDKGVLIHGIVIVKVLYVTNEDRIPFYSAKADIAFSYLLEVPNISKDCIAKVQGSVEQINATMLDSEELDIKIILTFGSMVFANRQETIMTDIIEEELDMEKVSELPSMVSYVAKTGDCLWEIGKKYYIPLAQIREINGVIGEPKTGDKILVIKSMSH